MKACSKCGVVKALDEFCRQATSRDGRKAQCRICSRRYFQAAYAADPDRYRIKVQSYYQANAETVKAKAKSRRERTPEQQRQYNLRYRAAHKDRAVEYRKQYREATLERTKERYRNWAAKNKDRLNARNAERRAMKLRATPAWANAELVAAYYTMAGILTEATGVEHQVDHIEPLRGEHVCGLHNEFNLQVLPAPVNAAKGNRPSEVRGLR